jgi:hypothetical protein
MSLISNSTQIVVFDSDGNIKLSQKYSDFLDNPKSEIQVAMYGNSLIDLLIQESYISSQNLELIQVLTGNSQADATRLIGNLAEALVVEYCNKYPEVNRTLARYARFGAKKTISLDNYIAIGTGSKVTESRYLSHYQPNDTQRDIIWVDKNDSSKQLACIGGSRNSVKPAGLQVKASHDGKKYVLGSIFDYYYPILYFDLGDDWGIVKNEAERVNPDATLIHPDEIMREIKEHLKGYFNIVVDIIEGELSIQDVIEQSMYNGDAPLLAGIAASNIITDKSIIIYSSHDF